MLLLLPGGSWVTVQSVQYSTCGSLEEAEWCSMSSRRLSQLPSVSRRRARDAQNDGSTVTTVRYLPLQQHTVLRMAASGTVFYAKVEGKMEQEACRTGCPVGHTHTALKSRKLRLALALRWYIHMYLVSKPYCC